MKGVFTIKTHKLLFSFFFITLLFFVQMHTVLGHSYVVDESPQANSRLEQSPNEIKIVFSSKVEKELFTIKVYDQAQQLVTNESPTISENQKEIKIQLPTLEGGNYKVEYYIVSSNDGHPVQGSFTFFVANPLPTTNEGTNSVNTEQPLSEENSVGNETLQITEDTPFNINNFNLTELLIFVMRAIYFNGLLLLIGWIFWWRNVQNYDNEVKKKFLFWGIIFQMLHLVGLISIILMQLNIFTMNGLVFNGDISINSTIGFVWIVSLFMSFIGFVFLFKNKWFDQVWIVVIAVLKSILGHSQQFEPTYLLVGVNSIHILLASLWAAGLTFIIVFWRKHRLYVMSFLPTFSQTAFVSMAILILTGSYLAFIYHANMDLFSDRGIVFLAKLSLVMIVLCTGAVIRSKLKKMKQANLDKWIKLDFTMMLLLIIVVSILTYLNPLS